jgi:signal transduction histidine kinase
MEKRTAYLTNSPIPQHKWLWLFLVLTVLALLNIGVIAADDLANAKQVHWLRHIINELSGAWLLLPLVAALLWFFKRYPVTRKNLWTRLPMHLLATLAFGLAHTLLMYVVRTPVYQLAGLGDYGKWYGILGYRMAMEYFKQFLFYWIFYGGFLFFEKLKETQRQQIRAAQLEEQLTKARLQALKMQLNPHFLFNTLNAISSMMYEDLDAADKMMATLSDMLRSTLKVQAEEHTLAEELELLERYLEIMKIRFKDTLDTRVEIEPLAQKALVPVFILQPLLENAIKYGMEGKGRVTVLLTGKAIAERLLLQVEDDGPGVQGLSRKGIGWQNTLERLENLFGENHVFSLENKASGGLRVTVGIPLHFEKI